MKPCSGKVTLAVTDWVEMEQCYTWEDGLGQGMYYGGQRIVKRRARIWKEGNDLQEEMRLSETAARDIYLQWELLVSLVFLLLSSSTIHIISPLHSHYSEHISYFLQVMSPGRTRFKNTLRKNPQTWQESQQRRQQQQQHMRQSNTPPLTRNSKTDRTIQNGPRKWTYIWTSMTDRVP